MVVCYHNYIRSFQNPIYHFWGYQSTRRLSDHKVRPEDRTRPTLGFHQTFGLSSTPLLPFLMGEMGTDQWEDEEPLLTESHNCPSKIPPSGQRSGAHLHCELFLVWSALMVVSLYACPWKCTLRAQLPQFTSSLAKQSPSFTHNKEAVMMLMIKSMANYINFLNINFLVHKREKISLTS